MVGRVEMETLVVGDVADCQQLLMLTTQHQKEEKRRISERRWATVHTLAQHMQGRRTTADACDTHPKLLNMVPVATAGPVAVSSIVSESVASPGPLIRLSVPAW